MHPSFSSKEMKGKAHMSRSVWKYSLSKHAACLDINGCCPKWSPIRVKAVGNSLYSFLLGGCRTIQKLFSSETETEKSNRFLRVQRCIHIVIWRLLVLTCHLISYNVVTGPTSLYLCFCHFKFSPTFCKIALPLQLLLHAILLTISNNCPNF